VDLKARFLDAGAPEPVPISEEPEAKRAERSAQGTRI
jgi:hypothetical protein